MVILHKKSNYGKEVENTNAYKFELFVTSIIPHHMLI
jgi:hypothetical protein